MAGDPGLDDLYHASYRRLVVQMYAICGDVAEAEDAVQDAFVAALRKQRELRRVANPEAWVRTAALNRLRNTWRHASVVRLYQPKVPGPQSPVQPSPDHVAIVTALARVDRKEREVVVLHYLADLGIADVARELGIAEGTVKSRLSRARPGWPICSTTGRRRLAMSELDRLRSLGDQVVPPSFEVLRETARRRTRRHAVAWSLAASVAVAAVVSAVLLADRSDRSTPEPVDPPREVSTTHPLTYALGATVHYGAQTVDAPADVVELDVTDAGVLARTADGRIWFTDGHDLEQVGTLGDPGSAYAEPDFPFGASWGFVVSDNTGVRAAWLEFPQPGEPELVVFDTQQAEETARVSLGVEPGSYALLSGITDRYGYWYSNPDVGEEPFPDQRVDLVSAATQGVSEEEYAADQPGLNTPRTMMISHAGNGEPPNYRWIVPATMRQFDVRAGRVEPQGLHPLDARDGGTGQRFEFDAPAGHPDTGPGWLVQWLDDDTVVIVQTRGGNDDLLECRHSTGACTLAERLPEAAVLPEAN